MTTREKFVDEAVKTVDAAELTEFMQYVEDRVSRKYEDVSHIEAQQAVEELFIQETQDMDEDLQEYMDREIDRTLEDYRSDDLFTVDVPAFDYTFDRDFYRHKRADYGTNGFKEVYVDEGPELIALVPKREKDFRGRAEQVMTWLHNAETITAHGYPVPAEYRLATVERDDVPYPALIGEYNHDMILGEEMTEEQRDKVWQELAEAGNDMSRLVCRGEVASSRVNDYYGKGTANNQAYDFVNDRVVVPDIGELYAPAFDNDFVEVDSREEFLQRHGIDKRVDQYMTYQGVKEV